LPDIWRFYNRHPHSSLDGRTPNDAYFGKVPADRLLAKDGRLFFRGDGERRSKIGLSPERATGILGSYDATSKLLTIVSYTQPAGASDYVNSMWEIQKQPYRGDYYIERVKVEAGKGILLYLEPRRDAEER